MELNRHPAAEPFVWLVVGIPAATVVAGIATLWIATHGADPRVSDNIDKHGLAIQQRAGRDDQARVWHVSGTLSSRQHEDAVRFTVALKGAPEAFASPPMLRLTHPARPESDRVLKLVPAADGNWHGVTPSEGTGGTRWILAVETPEWRIQIPGLHRFGLQGPVTFQAATR